jgi:peptidoglycan/xylan/chitin deacetylase (PgdA/CDA1 family)
LVGASALAANLAAVRTWSVGRNTPTTWPNGSVAAVSLTYDDGLASHLDNARPQLERFGFKGTFFLTKDNLE